MHLSPLSKFRARFTDRAWFALKAVTVYLAIFLSGAILINAIESHYRFGVDTQEKRCLPWKYFIAKVGVPDDIRKGDVLFLVLKPGRIDYSFNQTWLTKMVFGMPGDVLEIKQDRAYINGVPVTHPMNLHAKLGKKPGDFDRKETVPPEHYLMLGTEPNSYDGRYWGFVSKEEIIGRAFPLW